VGRIKRLFKWGVENEHVPATVYNALQVVVGLKEGRTEAKESEPVMPVPDALVVAVRPLVSPQVRAMIDLQLLTGMRPGEVVSMCRADLDTSGDIWIYTPSSHKTRHHGHKRVVPLGPKAKEVLKPFLTPGLRDHLFVPAAAEAERRQKAHAKRKTPLSCGNRPGTNRKGRPKRPPGGRFDVPSCRRAIARACEKAFPPPPPLARQKGETRDEWQGRLTPHQRADLAKWRSDHHWHVHQLRHNYATTVRKLFGIEAAQVMLGHRNVIVTELYAQKNVEAARKIAAQVG
jgi:integrase